MISILYHNTKDDLSIRVVTNILSTVCIQLSLTTSDKLMLLYYISILYISIWYLSVYLYVLYIISMICHIYHEVFMPLLWRALLVCWTWFRQLDCWHNHINDKYTTLSCAHKCDKVMMTVNVLWYTLYIQYTFIYWLLMAHRSNKPWDLLISNLWAQKA